MVAVLCACPLGGESEPGPVLTYVDPTKDECGTLWLGDEHQRREPAKGDFVRLGSLSIDSEQRCRSAREKLQLPPSDDSCRDLKRIARGIAPTDAPNQVIEQRELCEALGYRYVGELQAEVTRCYPELDILGDHCEPGVWIPIAVVGILFLSLIAVVIVLTKLRKSQT